MESSLKNSCADLFRSRDVAARRQILDDLSEEEIKALYYDWEFWARPNQKLPGGDWQFWVVKAGRGFGKTRVGAETVRQWVKDFPYVNLIAPTTDDVRNIMIEGESGILAICPPGERPLYRPSTRSLKWPNGAKSLLFSADEPDRLRGKQHMKLWCDELAAWRYPDSWDQAMFGLRLGANPQAVVTTTPKPVKHVKELLKDPRAVVTTGTTYDNAENLAPAFVQRIITKYEGTRLGRQELKAELLEDKPGALWTHGVIDDSRVTALPPEGEIERICVGVDPSVADPSKSADEPDECGIVIAARDKRQPAHFYVFSDMSLLASPDKWCDTVLRGYEGHSADRIVAEVNNGGALVESLLRTKGKEFAYKAVHAAKGKLTRAEPISGLYEQGRVHHVGVFAQLEDELCDYDGTGNSPNRLDATVWALTELSEGSDRFGLLGYMSDGQADADLKEIMKIKGATNLAKPMVADQAPGCPECSSKLIQRLGDGFRCGQCGIQWRDKNAKSGTKSMSRAEYLAEQENKRR